MIDLWQFHRLAAEAYGRNESLENASDQLAKARQLLQSLPEDQRSLASADLEILDADIRLKLTAPSADKLREEAYEAIAGPLRRALQTLAEGASNDPLAALPQRWRWLNASNLMARLDRLNKNFKDSRSRYQDNLDRCQAPFADNLNIRRMKAEALNGLANLDLYQLDSKTAQDRTDAIAKAISEYRDALELREAVLAADPDQVWQKHEVGITSENLAGAIMLRIAADPKLTAEQKSALTADALKLRQQRLEIHAALSDGDPGNRLFEIAYAHAIANLVRQEALYTTGSRPPAPATLADWFERLGDAVRRAPREPGILEAQLELLHRYRGDAGEIERVTQQIQRLRKAQGGTAKD